MNSKSQPSRLPDMSNSLEMVEEQLRAEH